MITERPVVLKSYRGTLHSRLEWEGGHRPSLRRRSPASKGMRSGPQELDGFHLERRGAIGHLWVQIGMRIADVACINEY